MSSRLPMGVGDDVENPAMPPPDEDENGDERAISLLIIFLTPLSPVARIAKVAVDSSLRNLGDHRQAALELRKHDALGDVVDKALGETGGNELRLV